MRKDILKRSMPLFADFQPDLVMLDLRMPHIDGLSLMKQYGTASSGE